MTEFADTIAGVPGGKEKYSKLFGRAVVVAGLGCVAIAAKTAEYTGQTQEMADGLWRSAVESGAHLWVGAVGALIAIAIAKRRLRRQPPGLASAFVGGSIANFGIEAMQDGVLGVAQQIQGGQPLDTFISAAQSAETPKDYLFAVGGALGGVALAAAIDKRMEKRKEKNVEQAAVVMLPTE